MHLRLSAPVVLSLVAVATSALHLHVEAQVQRGAQGLQALPVDQTTPRRRPFRLTLTYQPSTDLIKSQPVRYAPPAPRSPSVSRSLPSTVSHAASAVPATSARSTLTPRSEASKIAVGAYFWNDGKCAPGDDGAVSAWRERVGRLPEVWLIYQSWSGWNEFPAKQAERARELGGRLLVTWEPWSGSVNDSNWSCANVASGAQDKYIRRYARAVADVKVPVMVRFAHEMNGNWYPWGTAYGAGKARHNGNSPQNFVAMWRRVVGIFKQERATNVAWVWAPNIHYMNDNNSQEEQNRDLAALYPGDSYVDWIGLSIYNDGSRRTWNSFSTLFDATYQTITRLSVKPMMIAEMGATEAGAPSGTSKAAWIEEALTRDIPNRYPRVKLVNWFCRDKTSSGEANYRFDSSPASLRAFRYAVNSPVYSGQM